MNKYQMVTELNDKDYVAFARRFVNEAVDAMDFEELRSRVVELVHEDLQKSYDDLGQTAAFENMSAWNCDVFDNIAENYNLKLEDEWEGY